MLKELDISGKTALVTGTGRGWAPFLAAALAEAGANVAVAGEDEKEAEAAARAVRDQGQKALTLKTDLTRGPQVRSAVRQVVSQLGGLDILVTSQQVEFGKPLVQVTEAEWDRLMALNVRSVFLCCREAGKVMVQQGRGRIVNIISGLAERGMVNWAAYCATQGAVLQITRALALEWGRQDIRVNAIGTGFVAAAEVSPEEAEKDRVARYIPSRRRGHPRDLAGALVYLVSDACGYITGNCVYLDGGLMSHP